MKILLMPLEMLFIAVIAVPFAVVGYLACWAVGGLYAGRDLHRTLHK